MNVVLLRGVASSDARLQTLPSGSALLQIELTTRDADGVAASVPVVWFDAPATPAIAQGDELVVLGRVRRRFFRAGGATRSSTEVLASKVVKATRRAAVGRLVDTASGLITGELIGAPSPSG